MLRGLWRAEPVIFVGGLLLVVWPIWALYLPSQLWGIARLLTGVGLVLMARQTVFVLPTVRDMVASAFHRGAES